MPTRLCTPYSGRSRRSEDLAAGEPSRPSIWSGLEMAQARVREQDRAAHLGGLSLTALEGKSGADAAAVLHMQVGTVFKAKSKVQQMLREEVKRLEREETRWESAPAVPNSKNS